jgi:mono/diheme cytochrome c family protein
LSCDFHQGDDVNKIFHALLLAFALLSWSAGGVAAMPSDAQDPTNSDSVRVGRSVAQRNCARCHAVGPRGASRNPKSPPFRTIVARNRARHLPGALFLDGTVLRHPGMPQFELRTAEVDGLIAYVRSLAK